MLETERFVVLLLDTRRHLIRLEEVGRGLDSVLVHPREVFRPAILGERTPSSSPQSSFRGSPRPAKPIPPGISSARELLLKVSSWITSSSVAPPRSVPGFLFAQELGQFYSRPPGADFRTKIMIHPDCSGSSGARLGAGTSVGAHSVVSRGRARGRMSGRAARAPDRGDTRAGSGNRFHAGCVIRDAPQDAKYTGQPTHLRIGEKDVFRERVTVHRSNRMDGDTVIGDGNFLMAGCPRRTVTRIGSQVILANGAPSGGSCHGGPGLHFEIAPSTSFAALDDLP